MYIVNKTILKNKWRKIKKYWNVLPTDLEISITIIYYYYYFNAPS